MNERQAKRPLSVLLVMILVKSLTTFSAPPSASFAKPLAQEQTKPVNDGWSPPVEARRRNLKVASYRAKLAGDALLVEVTHEPGWHTYALDNLERAKKKAGEPLLGIEKSTRFVLSGGLRTIGRWRQSLPKDLSQPEINWFTWGFEDTALFAVKIQRSGKAKEAVITINGQACKETTCVLIDDLEIRLPLNASSSEKTTFDLTSLIEQGDLKDVRE
jgi:DsbC/DsbD-like thiol-disulfide interchange protein